MSETGAARAPVREAGPQPPALRDALGRPIRYLRLSVTESCNFSCAYCGPGGGPSFEAASEATADELVRIAGVLVSLGVRGVRVTGGEPLLRPDVVEIVRRLRALDPALDLSLTTNGFHLAALAEPLKRAGLDRVNVSLDSMDPEVFRRLAGVEGLEAVREGIGAAFRAGLSPVKVNVVVVKGLNDGEVPAFARLTETFPLHIRFIELMPFGRGAKCVSGRRLPLGAILARAGPLEPVPPGEAPHGMGPAKVYRRPGAAGTLGFIAAVSGRFCESCNRVRVTSQGLLLPCLAAEGATDLLALLRAGASDAELRSTLRRAVSAKPSGHAFGDIDRGKEGPRPGLCGIGG